MFVCGCESVWYNTCQVLLVFAETDRLECVACTHVSLQSKKFLHSARPTSQPSCNTIQLTVTSQWLIVLTIRYLKHNTTDVGTEL